MSSGEMSRREKKGKRGDNSSSRIHIEETVLLLQWDALPPENIEELLKKTDGEVYSKLKKTLDFSHYRSCMKEAALLQYYVCGFCWAKEANFTPTQTSFTMAVLQMLLDNISEKQMALVDNLVEFAKVLGDAFRCTNLEEDNNNNNTTASFLDREKAMSLTSYIRESLFEKYRLYEILFTTPRDEQLSGLEKSIDVFSCQEDLTPLEEGIPTDLYP